MIQEGQQLLRRGQEDIRKKTELQTREEREELEQRKSQQAEENAFGAGQGGQVEYTNTRGSQGMAQPAIAMVLPSEGLAVEPKQVITAVQEDDEMVGVVKGGSAALIG